MAKKESDEYGEYVPVVYARSSDEAERYCHILEDHDIPAIMDEDYEPPTAEARSLHPEGVSILVPESLLEDAHACIAQLEEMKSFGEDEDEEDEEEFGPMIGFEVKGEEEQQSPPEEGEDF